MLEAVEWRTLYVDESVFDNGMGAFEDAPSEGVLWVDVLHGPYRMRLVGFDNYWLDEVGDSFGVYNDPENADWYPGAQSLAWRWIENGSECVTPATPTPGVHALRGALVPDEVAWKLGLLRPGEHLTPRPG